MTRIASVSSLVAYLKRKFDADYKIQNLLVKGEISNFVHHRSNHFYFTLKDEKSRINCIMFKSYAMQVKFKPKDGDKVILTVNTSIYEGSGQLQLYVMNMQLDGIGDLYLEYERLKKQLAAEGLFAQEHKKQINRFPQKIAIIVGKNTAAREDVITTLKRRWPMVKITEINVLVQGEKSSEQIIKALKLADTLNFDTIILARGGGSIEDLNSFNNEELARVVYNLETPIISGVGHETDTTIIDYVVDLRAPTPTAAAELAVNSLLDVYNDIENKRIQLLSIISNKIKQQKLILKKYEQSQVFTNPYYVTSSYHLKLNFLEEKLYNYTNIIPNISYNLQQLQNRLTKILNYKLHDLNLKIVDNRNLLIKTIEQNINHQIHHFDTNLKLLNAYSPLNSLQRGYSLAYINHKLVKSVKEVKPASIITLNLYDGKITALVKEIHNGKDDI